MRKIYLFLAVALLAISGCTNQTEEKVIQITDDNEIEQALSHFTCEKMLLGYGYASMYKADINEDGEYEIYISAYAGSGIVNFFVECYDPATGQVTLFNKRMETDYQLVEYKDKLYIAAYDYDAYFIGKPEEIYEMELSDGYVKLKDISKMLQKKIIKQFD